MNSSLHEAEHWKKSSVASTPLDLQKTDANPVGETDLYRALKQLDSRRADAYLRCSVGSLRCGLRVCEACCSLRSRRLLAHNRVILGSMDNAAFITLTRFPIRCLRRGTIEGTRLMLKRFWAHPKIELHIRGGIMALEANHSGATWNIHAHAIAECLVMPANSLVRDCWRAVGGGQQTDCRPISPGEIEDVFRYISKRPEVPDRAKLLGAFLGAFRGTHQLTRWGVAHPASREYRSLRGLE